MKGKLLKFIYPLLKLFWKIFQPRTLGVRILLIRENKILLVKHSYSQQWFLPGGAMQKDETFETAIRRELKEELGITVETLKLHGIYNNFFEGKKDHIFVFVSEEFQIDPKKDAEIEEYDFFNLHLLPSKISPGTERRIKEFLENQTPYHGMW